MFMAGFAFPQSGKGDVRDGNKAYKKGDFKTAEAKYKKATDKNPQSFEGYFNLGDTYYKQKKYDKAADVFKMIADQGKTKEDKAKAYHNLGNALMQGKKYQECVEAYKKSLLFNPNDKDTKYNLAYAQAMLRQQQQQQQKNKNDKNDQKNQQQKQQQQQQNEQNKQQQQKQQQAQPKHGEISKEDAERMLEAIEKDEKNVQDKVKKENMKAVRIHTDKDW